MSIDRKITDEIIETLKDGQKGYAAAADKLADTDRADLAGRFSGFAEQRALFAAELEKMAASYGDHIDEDGSALASVHRVWMSLKDGLSGSDPDGVLDAAEQGEQHAVDQYRDALDTDGLSPDLRDVLTRQQEAVEAAHAEVQRLKATS